MLKPAFDSERYIELQIRQIQEIVEKPGDRIYMEIGGKLIQDRHAARVLPGYHEDARFHVLKEIGQIGEVALVVSAKDLLRGRIRGDFKITYDQETVRTIEELRERGVLITQVVVSLFEQSMKGSPVLQDLEKALVSRAVKVSYFYGSTNHQSSIFFQEDLEKNPFLHFSSRLVAVISPGGGSGKFGVCLSQLYHEMKQGRAVRYFSLGAFPIYELPATHPLNLAYLAATSDIKDILKIDPNTPKSLLTEREIENYSLLKQLTRAFLVEGRYLAEIGSATEMCISCLAQGITDDEEVCREAAAEIARRYMRYSFEVERGEEKPETVERVRLLLDLL